MADGIRIDKWLWAARFFKTRRMAQDAVLGGKVRLAGRRVKPGKQLAIDDVLSITRGEDEFIVTVLDLDDRRLSAPLAREKYEEDPECARRREEAARKRRRASKTRGKRPRRPDKRQRRQIVRFTRKRS